MRTWVLKLAAATAACLLIIAVLAGGSAAQNNRPSLDDSPAEGTNTRPVTPEDDESGSPIPTPKNQPPDAGEDPGSWWLLALLGVAGGAVAGYLWRRRQSVLVDDPEDSDPTSLALDQAVASLRVSGRPTDAITACWRALEGLADQRGVRRKETETVEEFAIRLAQALRLPGQPLTRLGALFEHSWYSQFGSAPDDRAEAQNCLETLRTAARGSK